MTVTVREATRDDGPDLLAWRNDPVTRAMSRAMDPVEPADHHRWFERALRDPDCTLLIGQDGAEKIGMVRLARGLETEVSINLNPAARGRGLGLDLLTKALADARDAVVALLKPENLARLRLFEGAGFVFEDKRDGLARYVRPAPGGAA